MSAVCVLTPIIIGNWPVITAAVAGAVTAMGFTSVKDVTKTLQEVKKKCKEVTLQVENSEAVTDALSLDQSLVFTRNNVTLHFSRDARGRCAVKVYGNQSDGELKKIGQEVSQRIVQQYVYNRLMTELQGKNYHIVEESVDDKQTIQIKVRKWEA